MWPLKERKQWGLFTFQSFSWLSVELGMSKFNFNVWFLTQKLFVISGATDQISHGTVWIMVLVDLKIRKCITNIFIVIVSWYNIGSYHDMHFPLIKEKVFSVYIRRHNFFSIDELGVGHCFPVAFENHDGLLSVSQVIVVHTVVWKGFRMSWKVLRLLREVKLLIDRFKWIMYLHNQRQGDIERMDWT